MNRKLLSIALFSSPLLALYGSSAFYIFDKLSFRDFIIVNVPLSISIFINWILFIYSYYKFPKLNPFLRFLLMILINIIFRVLFAISIKDDPAKYFPQLENYLAHPIISSLGINAIIMIICHNIISNESKAKTELELEKQKLLMSEAQKQSLLQQIQPHFLFNALSNLKSLIKSRPLDAEKYTIQLSEFLRYTSDVHKSETVSIFEEIEFTKDYIELQKMRFGDTFQYNIDIPGPILKKQIPVLAIQTLVENIFKHNYFTEKNPIVFSIICSNNKIIVKNNKSSKQRNEISQGIGLENVNKRYQLIKKEKIDIINNENEFIVHLPIIGV